MSQRDPSPFGRLLRQWRAQRGMSQLGLATEAGVSTRHLSFVETGRSHPSREMVLRLAETLDVPLRERNALLAAAGFASLYRETALEAPELEPLRRMLDFLLERHEPFPAFLLDRCWNAVRANGAAARGFGVFAGPGPVWADQPLNLLRVTLHPEGLRPFIVNFDEVAGTLLAHLERSLALFPGDEELGALRDEMHALPDLPAHVLVPNLEAAPQPVLPLHLKRDGLEVRLFSAITTLGTPQDITLQELRIESFMPADPTTEAALRAIAEAPAD
jgi:transcriptional regulator with XRE-family HTH domain